MRDILITDKFKRDFLNQVSDTVGKGNVTGGDRLLDYDVEDPTYIGFHIEFIFDQIESPSANVAGLLLDGQPGFSAVDYLNRINEPERAILLTQFINELKNIQEFTPWFFTGISGLKDLLTIDMTNSIRVKKDTKIVVNTLESIDLKIFRMFDRYRKATYDSIYMRDLLPENMRKFNMRIHFTEIRKFHTFIKDDMNGVEENKPQSPLMQAYGGMQDIYNLLPQTKIDNLINKGAEAVGVNNPKIKGTLANIMDANQVDMFQKSVNKIVNLDNFISVISLNLNGCTFDFENFAPFLDDISNDKIDMATNGFSIIPTKVTETNTYPLSSLVLRDVIKNSYFPGRTRNEFAPGNGPYGMQLVSVPDEGIIDDIIKMIAPDTVDNEDVQIIKDKTVNDLKSSSALDKINNAVGSYQEFKSDLQKRLDSLGINYDPMDAVEAEIKKKGEQLLNKSILGNIHGLAPTNVIESVKNAINGIQNTKDKNFNISELKLEGANPNELVLKNINLESSNNNFSITNSGLDGQESKLDISPNTLSGSQPTTLSLNNIDLKDTSSSTTISNVDLKSIPNETLELNNIELKSNYSNSNITEIKIEGVDVNTEIDKIELESNTNTMEIGNNNIFANSRSNIYEIESIKLDGNTSDLKSEKNIGFNDLDTTSKVTNIKFDSVEPEKLVPSNNLLDVVSNIQNELLLTNIYSNFDNPTKYEITDIKLDGVNSKLDITDITLNSADSKLDLTNNIGFKENIVTNNLVLDKDTNIGLKSNEVVNDIQEIKLKGFDEIKPSMGNISAESISYTPSELGSENILDESKVLNNSLENKENIYGKQ